MLLANSHVPPKLHINRQKQAYPTTISLKPVTVKALTLTFLVHINHLGFFDRVS